MDWFFTLQISLWSIFQISLWTTPRNRKGKISSYFQTKFVSWHKFLPTSYLTQPTSVSTEILHEHLTTTGFQRLYTGKKGPNNDVQITCICYLPFICHLMSISSCWTHHYTTMYITLQQVKPTTSVKRHHHYQSTYNALSYWYLSPIQ